MIKDSELHELVQGLVYAASKIAGLMESVSGALLGYSYNVMWSS